MLLNPLYVCRLLRLDHTGIFNVAQSTAYVYLVSLFDFLLIIECWYNILGKVHALYLNEYTLVYWGCLMHALRCTVYPV